MNDLLSHPSSHIAERAPANPIDILLIEDDPGDVLLTKEALDGGRICNILHIAKDGVEAMEYLRREGQFADASIPDLILLDLNMPRKDGRETLTEIKADERFHQIPVVVLTTSDSEQDILKSYKLQASCYISKPVDLKQFTRVVKSIEEFWLCVVKLPTKIE